MSSTRSANAIPLSGATNFDPDLPGELARFNRGGARGRVVRAFGSLPADPVGGGRPAYRLPPITTEQLFEHATALAAEGIEVENEGEDDAAAEEAPEEELACPPCAVPQTENTRRA